MIADPQPPTDDYEHERLRSTMAGVVSRGFHVGCRQLQKIWSALATILNSALQLAWQGTGIAVSAAYRAALAGRNVLFAAMGVGAGVFGAGMGALGPTGGAIADVELVVVDDPVPADRPLEPDVPPHETDATKEDADAPPDSSPDATSTIFASYSALSAMVTSMIGASDGDPADFDTGSPSSPEPDPTAYGAPLDDSDFVSI